MTWICNGCSVDNVVPGGAWFVLVMVITSPLLGLLILYATLGGFRHGLKWQSQFC